jgi:cobalt-zinc-cadmium efflux system outer membrane protein
MLVGVFQLLQAKREQIEAGASYVDALREYWIARTGVEQLLAGRMPETSVGGASSPNHGSAVLRD